MTRSMYLLLVLLLQGLLQSLATTQCGSDQTGLFQSNPKVLKGALEQEATGVCTDTSFDSGSVTDTSECAPSGRVLIPTDPAGFPHPGSLTCGVNACRMSFSAPDTDFYEFQNASNYLVCQENGACDRLHAKNLGAACCAGPTNNACFQSSLQLHSGDMCCGKGCIAATITGARNVACALGGCANSRVTLAGDLVISRSASGARFTFNESERHCIQVLGTGAATEFPAFNAWFTFQQSTNVSMKCNVGTQDCRLARVFLSKGSCFHVDCGSSGTNCGLFKVFPRVTGETDFKCYCTGTNCGWTSSYAYCETTTDTSPCGAGICPGTLPACMSDANTVDCDRLATTTTTTRAAAADAAVQGDPHLWTLDGKHYTLLKQGNFLLWGFSGETGVLVDKPGEKKTAEFEVLAHYAGHASFTKGLLFVDKSTMPNQALEVTTQDCLWHHWDGESDPSWRPIQSPHMNMGAFNLSTSLSSGQRKLEILLKHEGMRKLAQLWVSCRAGKQISAKVRMPSPQDLRFVRGELAPGRLSLAAGGHHEASQVANDPEYALTSDWGDLGGSASAASYFKLVDSSGPQSALFTICTEAVKKEFAKTCRKHLGDSAGDFYEQVMQDCVFDLCQGAGETSAELAAEIYNS